MARSVWTGSITIGMLNVPVKLISAVKRQSIAFNQVDDRTGSRIRYQKVAEATNEVVDSAHIVKGFDLGGEHYVIVTDDDLAPLAPTKSKEIAVDTFVPAEQITPTMFESSYILQPGKIAKPYALLAQALAGTGHVGIGKFVMRQKEYLVALRSDGQHLTLSTLSSRTRSSTPPPWKTSTPSPASSSPIANSPWPPRWSMRCRIRSTRHSSATSTATR